jgi:hypothetical protein
MQPLTKPVKCVSISAQSSLYCHIAFCSSMFACCTQEISLFTKKFKGVRFEIPTGYDENVNTGLLDCDFAWTCW